MTKGAYEKLLKLRNQCINILNDESITPDSLYVKKNYIYSLFILGTSYVGGILALVDKGQARSAKIVLRSIYEIWIDIQLLTSCRSHVWAYYLVANMEPYRIKFLKNRQLNEFYTKEEKRQRIRDSKKLLNLVKRRYKYFPAIPNVIRVNTPVVKVNPQGDYSTTHLTLLKKCKVIDYYTSLKVKQSESTTTLEDNYNTIYRHFSNSTHANVLELSTLFDLTDSGWGADISGGGNPDILTKILETAFLWHYINLYIFTTRVAVKNKRIPEDLSLIFVDLQKKEPDS